MGLNIVLFGEVILEYLLRFFSLARLLVGSLYKEKQVRIWNKVVFSGEHGVRRTMRSVAYADHAPDSLFMD